MKKKVATPRMSAPVGFPVAPPRPGPRKSPRTGRPGSRRALVDAVRAVNAAHSARTYNSMGVFTDEQIARTDREYKQFLKIRARNTKKNLGIGEHHGEEESAVE